MTDVLGIAAAALRRAGLRVGLRFGSIFRVKGRAGRSAAVLQANGKPWIDLLQDDHIVSRYAVTEWTPRHTSAVQAWIEEAIVDEDLGGEVEG